MKKLPRSYSQSSRRVSADLTRDAVLEAARTTLTSGAEEARFTVDNVAAAAGVSRATVFNLFGDKSGMLNALFDAMSQRAELMEVDALLMKPDAQAALRDYVRRFARFYEADRVLLKKLRAYAAFDADLSAVMQARDDKRTAGLLFLIERLRPELAAAARRERARQLKALLSFEVFESVAGDKRSIVSSAASVTRMAEAIVAM